MMKIFAAIGLMLWGAISAAAGLDIYLLRHAETQANASGIHNTVTSGTFSEYGEDQVRQLTAGLQGRHFDAVIASPTTRTLYTIAPYLQATGNTAEIWPEFAECCWQKPRTEDMAGRLAWGDGIILPADIAPQFIFRPGIPHRNFANNNYADGVAQIRQAASLIRERFAHSGKSVLLVLHYHSGAVLMAELLGVEREATPHLKNARLTHLQQDDDGNFHLHEVNAAPDKL